VGAGYTGLWIGVIPQERRPNCASGAGGGAIRGYRRLGARRWLSARCRRPHTRGRPARPRGVSGGVAAGTDRVHRRGNRTSPSGRGNRTRGPREGGTIERSPRKRAQAAVSPPRSRRKRSWQVDGPRAVTAGRSGEGASGSTVVSAYFNPHCARYQPARLARGSPDAVARPRRAELRRVTGPEISSGPRRSRCRETVRRTSCCAPPSIHRRTEGYAPALEPMNSR